MLPIKDLREAASPHPHYHRCQERYWPRLLVTWYPAGGVNPLAKGIDKTKPYYVIEDTGGNYLTATNDIEVVGELLRIEAHSPYGGFVEEIIDGTENHSFPWFIEEAMRKTNYHKKSFEVKLEDLDL